MLRSFLTSLWLVLICMLLLGSAHVQNPAGPVRLDQPNSLPSIDRETLTEAINRLLVSNHLVGGEAVYFDCRSQQPDTAKISFNLAGLTIRQALDLMLENSDYRWMEVNQEVLVYPAKGIPDLLKTRVKSFEFDKPRHSPFAATEEILRLPEIVAGMQQNNLKEQRLYVLAGPSRYNAVGGKVVVDNVSLYEGLDALGRGSSAVWTYSEYHCNRNDTFQVVWSSF